MLFFVKTECPPNKINECTEKVASHEISIAGNQSWVSMDGRYGFDIVEARDERDCRQKYERYRDYLRILELSPCCTMKEFIEQWQTQRGRVTPETYEQPQPPF